MGKTVTKFGHGDQKGIMRHVESLPNLFNIKSFGSSRFSNEIKDLHEVLPMSKSKLDDTNMLDQKFDEDKSDALTASKPESDLLTKHFEPIKHPASLVYESSKEYIEKEIEDNDFSIVEKMIELFSEEQARSKEVFIMVAISIVESLQVVEINFGIGVNCEECSQLYPSNEKSGSNQGEVFVVQDCNSKEDD